MNLVWDCRYSDSQKIVMLALADQANDQGQCWPSISTIARRCSRSERTIQATLRELEKAGDVTRYDRAGTSSMFRIHPRSDRTPEIAAPPQPLHPTPAAAAPLPPQPLHPTPPNGCTLTTNEPPLEPPSNHQGAKDRFQLPDEIPQEEWAAFEEMRKRLKKPLTDHARKIAIKTLRQLADEGHPPGKVLNQSIFNGWQGLFPIKGAGNGNGNRNNIGSGNGLLDATLDEMREGGRFVR